MLPYKVSLLGRLGVFNYCLKRYLEINVCLLYPKKDHKDTQNQITNTRTYVYMCLWAGPCFKICSQASF